MSIKTRIYTRVDHDGLHAECNDTHGGGKWRTCVNNVTTEHVPPSFSTGMTRSDLKRMRDLCNHILQDVYGDYS